MDNLLSVIWINITVKSHEHQEITNHQQLDCLFNNLFKLTTKKIWIFHVTDILWGEPPVTYRFPCKRPVMCKVSMPLCHYMNTLWTHTYPTITGELWVIRADSRLASSQWETTLQSNAVSHWLGASLESALVIYCQYYGENWPFYNRPNCIILASFVWLCQQVGLHHCPAKWCNVLMSFLPGP